MNKLLAIIEQNWLALSFVLLCAITLLSLWPMEKLPAVPGGDKTHHLVAYAALMFPAALKKPKGWILIGLFFIFYSGAIEILQPYVNRYGEWLDMAANSCGVVCGWLLAEGAGRIARKSSWKAF